MVWCLVHLSSNIFWLRVCLIVHVVVRNIVILLHITLVCLTTVLGHFYERLPHIKQEKCDLSVGRNLCRHEWNDIIARWIICSTSFPLFSFLHSLSNVCRFFFNNSRVFVYKYAAKVLLITNGKATHRNWIIMHCHVNICRWCWCVPSTYGRWIVTIMCLES